MNTLAIDAVEQYLLDLQDRICTRLAALDGQAGFREDACPVDAVVETRIFEYHGERRGDLYYTKQMLLANGDRYEAQIAKDREQDAPYR